jgi:glycosyltransferase involved in cell wall biosynthesis
MKEKVSVIIPMFNRGELVLETLTSVFKQTYSNYECIIIDDHSTDNAFNLVKQFSAGHPQFIVRSRQSAKKGACACRNEGLDLATGDYIMFLDSDDLLSENCLGDRVTKMLEHPECDFVVCQIGIFKHEDYVVTHYYSSLKHDDDLEAFLNAEGWQTSSTFFRAQFINKYRFDEDALSWQDVDIHLRILLDKPRYRKFPESQPDVYMRHSGFERISNSNARFDRADSRLRLLKKLEVLFESREVIQYRRAFLVYYFKFLEIAALLLPTDQFEYLYNIWRGSKTFHETKASFYAKYIRLQHQLKKLHLRIICSILYRVMRCFVPHKILYATERQIPIKQQIVILESHSNTRRPAFR